MSKQAARGQGTHPFQQHPLVHEMNLSSVRVRAMSADRKLSPVSLEANTTDRPRPTPRAPFVSSTYVSIGATCPDSCTFKGDGCYASAGFTGESLRKMDSVAGRKRMSGDQVIAQEVRYLDTLFPKGVPQDGARGGRDLRLHVGGDVSSTRGARKLAAAAERWVDRDGGSVWTFTARWRSIPKDAWGGIAVLASVTQPRDALAAQRRGYAPAIVVDKHRSEKSYAYGGLKVIPCPAETTGTNCVTCRLCLDRDLHGMGVAIGFAIHGSQAGSARRRLPVVVA